MIIQLFLLYSVFEAASVFPFFMDGRSNSYVLSERNLLPRFVLKQNAGFDGPLQHYGASKSRLNQSGTLGNLIFSEKKKYKEWIASKGIPH